MVSRQDLARGRTYGLRPSFRRPQTQAFCGQNKHKFNSYKKIRKLGVDRQHDFRPHFRFRAPPPVGHVNRIAVAMWAAPVSAQHFDHLKAIRAKPFAFVLPLHLLPPFFSAHAWHRRAVRTGITPTGVTMDSTPACALRVHGRNLSPQSGKTLGRQSVILLIYLRGGPFPRGRSQKCLIVQELSSLSAEMAFAAGRGT